MVSIPTRPYAANVLTLLKEMGHEIVILTARDNRYLTNQYEDTMNFYVEEWLTKILYPFCSCFGYNTSNIFIVVLISPKEYALIRSLFTIGPYGDIWKNRLLTMWLVAFITMFAISGYTSFTRGAIELQIFTSSFVLGPISEL